MSLIRTRIIGTTTIILVIIIIVIVKTITVHFALHSFPNTFCVLFPAYKCLVMCTRLKLLNKPGDSLGSKSSDRSPPSPAEPTQSPFVFSTLHPKPTCLVPFFIHCAGKLIPRTLRPSMSSFHGVGMCTYGSDLFAHAGWVGSFHDHFEGRTSESFLEFSVLPCVRRWVRRSREPLG